MVGFLAIFGLELQKYIKLARKTCEIWFYYPVFLSLGKS